MSSQPRLPKQDSQQDCQKPGLMGKLAPIKLAPIKPAPRIAPTVSVLHQVTNAGLTLIELMTALAVTGVVVLGGGSLLVAVLSSRNAADASLRQHQDLERVLTTLTSEIKTASRVNMGNSTVLQATQAATAVTDSTSSSEPGRGPLSPLPATAPASVGTFVLYLEIPLKPMVCGSVPAPPFDRVIYDIRPNTSTWLGPQTINRYGRPLGPDGQPDPCATPLASQVLGDGIADTTSPPPCDTAAGWQLSGAHGFYSCVSPDGRTARLHLMSQFTDTGGKTHTGVYISATAYRRGL